MKEDAGSGQCAEALKFLLRRSAGSPGLVPFVGAENIAVRGGVTRHCLWLKLWSCGCHACPDPLHARCGCGYAAQLCIIAGADLRGIGWYLVWNSFSAVSWPVRVVVGHFKGVLYGLWLATTWALHSPRFAGISCWQFTGF